jgi:hypothetical protein
MAVRLNRPGFEHAKRLIGEGSSVRDDRGAWSEHRADRGPGERVHRSPRVGGLPPLAPRDRRGARPGDERPLQVPLRDFVTVHRCGVLAAESRAGQRKYTDIELAAAHLHGMLESAKDHG